MSALRMPQHLAEAAHVGSGEARLKMELLEELDGSVAVHRAEDALAALRVYDEAHPGQRTAPDRAPLLDAAVIAVWRLVVRHEACDCCDHHDLMERHRIPPEVMSRIGAFS